MRIRLYAALFVYSRPIRGQRGMALCERYWVWGLLTSETMLCLAECASFADTFSQT